MEGSDLGVHITILSLFVKVVKESEKWKWKIVNDNKHKFFPFFHSVGFEEIIL